MSAPGPVPEPSMATAAPSTLLIANRGEIAIRIADAAAELGLATVAVYSTDDAASLHVVRADRATGLPGRGAAAYLDIDAIVAAALETGCDAVHPGYGFLSEHAGLARACAAAGLLFVGPTPEVLELFGDKTRARRVAAEAGIPVLAGSPGPVTMDEARAFLDEHGPLMLKATSAGGGRGIRPVREPDELEAAYRRCVSEAGAAFGSGANRSAGSEGSDGSGSVFVERLLGRPRHIEVQVVADAHGGVTHLGERDCSIQRRHQKIVELAPAPHLPEPVRERLHRAAVDLASAVGYRGLGTVEFLVDADGLGPDSEAYFIEVNPRLQVEHTVTEEVTGVDLVQVQLRLAGGATLADVGLDQPIRPSGSAIQLRINCETMQPDGEARPSGGTLTAFELPAGRGTRVDTYGYAGYTTNPSFDSLLAKLIVSRPTDSLERLADAAGRAAADCRIEGVATNLGFLRNLLRLPAFRAGDLDTGLISRHLTELVVEADAAGSRFPRPANGEPVVDGSGRAGAKVDRSDPLAVLDYGRAGAARADVGPPGSGAGFPGAGAGFPGSGAVAHPLADGLRAVVAPLQGTVVEVSVTVGDTVMPGQQVAIMESMKMEHEIRSEVGGVVERVDVEVGDTFFEGHLLVVVAESDVGHGVEAVADEVDLDHIRDDLAYIVERHELVLDENRPAAVARRRATGHRTARENVADLVDGDSFVEYGPMVVAAQKSRRSMEDLLVRSPADGLITGVGSVNGELFDDPVNRCAVMAYDYTVFAGTQGIKNHAKTDRILQVARQGRMPFILFGEGGGGRPGDTDGGDFGSWTFNHFAALSGLVPMVGITTGFCFAGNASILGCCDVIIATEGSNIGMGGPAMVEGGGLGVFRPEEIGSLDVQRANGVVDIVVADEAEAVDVAKRYLAYFQGPVEQWEANDQRRMRPIVPENRLRVYEVREVIDTIADVGSVLELRRDFGVGIITSLIRIEGRPMGVVANNPLHLGGAIDADGSDKGARFMQLCDAFDIPLLFLCDTPGIMVGPEVERTALVRKSSRMFVTGANLTVPSFAIILRKAYGLGAVAMSAASFKQPMAMVSWPTGEFGPMGLEGAVKLGFRDELAAIDDPEERRALYDKLVNAMYTKGKGDRLATAFGVDDTIDPADSRRWVANLLAAYRPPPERDGKKRAWIDAW